MDDVLNMEATLGFHLLNFELVIFLGYPKIYIYTFKSDSELVSSFLAYSGVRLDTSVNIVICKEGVSSLLNVNTDKIFRRTLVTTRPRSEGRVRKSAVWKVLRLISSIRLSCKRDEE